METKKTQEEKTKEINEIEEILKVKGKELEKLINERNKFCTRIGYNFNEELNNTIYILFYTQDNGHYLCLELEIKYKNETLVADVKENYRNRLIGVSSAEAINYFVYRTKEMIAF